MRSMLAIVATFCLFGVSQAQQPMAPAPMAMPMHPTQPGHLVPTHQHAHPGVAVVAPQACGCQECTNRAKKDRPGLLRRFVDKLTIGEGCADPICCSSFAADRTFLFGSCKQFFNAGNKCYGKHSGCQSCADQGGPCKISSYLNR